VTIFVILSLLLVLAFAVRGPGLALLFYGVFAADSDGFGILQYVGDRFEYYKLFTRVAYLLLFAGTLLLMLGPLRSRLDARLRKMMLLPIMLSMWIVVTSFMKGYGFQGSLSYLVYSGLPAYVIWISTARHERFRKYFLAFVFVQITLAVAVIGFPALHGIDGASYAWRTGVDVSNSATGVNLALPTGTTIKGSIARYAQFHNPNDLGFYGVVALACGYSLIRRPGFRLKIMAVLFLVLGLVAWLNSLTRGPILGMLLGISLFLLLANRDKTKGRIILMFRAAVMIPMVLLSFLALWYSQLFSFLIPAEGNISVTGRLPGYSRGFLAIAKYPAWGVDSAWDWTSGYPHFLPLLFAGEYGVLAGIAIFAIVFGMGGWIVFHALRTPRSQSRLESQRILAILLVLIVMGMACTDNIAAPLLFWVCFGEAALLMYGKEDLESPSAHPLAGVGEGDSGPLLAMGH
jgi:hypothetical protein